MGRDEKLRRRRKIPFSWSLFVVVIFHLAECVVSDMTTTATVPITVTLPISNYSTAINSTSMEYCHPGLPSFGYTKPYGDIVLETGQTLEIFCILNKTKARSKNYTIEQAWFYFNNETIDPRYITVMNETTLRLRMENMTELHGWFGCELGPRDGESKSNAVPNSLEVETNSPRDSVCWNLVSVGTKPKEATNLTCISENWEVLNCSWTAPYNAVKTQYRIYYQVPKRAGRSRLYQCPTSDDWMNNWCAWKTSSDPPYRNKFEFIKIFIVGSNKFGEYNSTMDFKNYGHIVPTVPTSLTLENKTSNSIYLSWNIHPFDILLKPLLHKVQYTTNSSNSWQVMTIRTESVNLTGEKFYLNVTNLKPNTLYDFRVQMKVEAYSPPEEGYTKIPAYNIFRTLACPPTLAPRMDIGSFEIEPPVKADRRSVYVYWQSIPKADRNGDNFRYEIELMGGEKSAVKSVEKESYATFEIGTLPQTFRIRSVNKEGPGNVWSTITVPSAQDLVKPCTKFTKIDYGNGLYELAWEPPPTKSSSPLHNFTIFWCESKKERPFQCDGFIDWKHLPVTERKHNVTLDAALAYQFAISANTATSSSGMTWATCTVQHGHVGVVRDVKVDQVGWDYVTFEWKLECSDQANTLRGYRIFYCEVDASKNANILAADMPCSQPERNVTVNGDAYTTAGRLNDLLPCTDYKISVALVTKDGRLGPRSTIDQSVRTMDGPPDVTDCKIRELNHTNTTVEIEWDMPKKSNGVIRKYVVNVNNAQFTVGNVTNYRIQNLESYKRYNVSVHACTETCSTTAMAPIEVQTSIGTPGLVPVNRTERNSTHAFMSWTRPERAAGPAPVYELLIMQNNDKEVELHKTNDTKLVVAMPDCSNEKSRSFFTFKVRAKNRDAESGREYLGDWSSVYSLDCPSSDIPVVWKVSACIIIPLFFGFVFIYCGRKGVYKCKQMKTVQVSIPTKFTLSTNVYAGDMKDIEMLDNYAALPPQIKSPDEFSNLVEKTTELVR